MGTQYQSAHKHFGHRNTLTEIEYFYGREQQLKALADKINLGQSVSVIGPRTIGKSSLLYYLANARDRWPEWGLVKGKHALVRLDFQNLAGRLGGSELLSYMMKQAACVLEQEEPGDDPEEIEKWLEKQRAAGKHLVFLFDEFDAVSQIQGLEPRHFSYLRSLDRLANLVYLTASRDSLYELTRSAAALDSPFFNVFHEMTLGVFSDQEAKQMIFGRNDERAGLFKREDVAHLHELTAWRPLVLSLACAQLSAWRIVRGAEVDWEEFEQQLASETRRDYRYAWDQLKELRPAQIDLLKRLRAAPRASIGPKESGDLERLLWAGFAVRVNEEVRVVPGLQQIIDVEDADTAASRALAASRRAEASDTSELMLQRLGEIITGPVLNNYQGYACVNLTDQAGQPLPLIEQGLRSAAPNQPLQLCVWLAPEAAPPPSASEEVSITDGADANEVRFDITIDSEGLNLSRRRDRLLVQPPAPSRQLLFACQTPPRAGRYYLWVQVRQKNRLIQVLQAALQVEEN